MSAEAQDSSVKRSGSRTRSRPTTPLRPSSRSSFRDSSRESVIRDTPFLLNTFEPAFAELSDAMADLEANMMHFQLMHESLARFNENFAGFLYGLEMNAFCVEFPEGPIPESFRLARQQEENEPPRIPNKIAGEFEGETTFMTTDTSFVENPSAPRPTPKLQTPQPPRQSRMPAPSSRGGTRGDRGTQRGARASGLARPRGRGIR